MTDLTTTNTLDQQVNTQAIEDAKAAYDAAQANQAAAKKALEDLNASLAESRKQFDALKKILDGAKPSLAIAKAQLQKADADVTITRANLNALSPVAAPVSTGKGAGQSELCSAVRKVLQAAGKPMSVDEILTAVRGEGVEMAGANPRDNLAAYIGRWSKVPEAGIVNKGRGLWGAESGVTVLEKTYPLNDSAEVPAFLAAPAAEGTGDTSAQGDGGVVGSVTPEVPAFLTATPAGYVDAPTDAEVGAAEDTSEPLLLPEGFPGRDALIEAGIDTQDKLSGKTHDQLRRIKGIGAATAKDILAALEA